LSKSNYIIDNSISTKDDITALYSENGVKTKYRWQNIKEEDKNNNKKISATVDSQEYIWKIKKNEYDDIKQPSLLIDVEINTDIHKLTFLHFLNVTNAASDIKEINDSASFKLDKYLNKGKQREYIIQNKDTLFELSKNCFPSNIDKFSEEILKDVEKEVFDNLTKNSITSKNSIWFFATYNNKIVGYCYIDEANINVLNENMEIPTYEIIKQNNPVYDIYDKSIQKSIYPYIYSLCKDTYYNKIGSFLLNSIYDYLKTYTTYTKLYLTAGSSIYQYYKNKCIFDSEKYTKSNKELVNYYKNNNFTISKTLYSILKCGDVFILNKDIHTDIICYNVLYRNIKD
jgi:hypothetical protein